MSRTAAPPELLTAEQFVERYPRHRVELIDGRVRELPVAGAGHGKVYTRVSVALCVRADAGDFGHVMGNDTYVRVRTDPDAVLGPDVCYVSYDRLPRGPVPAGVLTAAPDLTVEGRSPSDTRREMLAKADAYLAAGVRAVVVLDSDLRTATVCRPGVARTELAADAELTMPEVLPGFAVRPGQLFE